MCPDFLAFRSTYACTRLQPPSTHACTRVQQPSTCGRRWENDSSRGSSLVTSNPNLDILQLIWIVFNQRSYKTRCLWHIVHGSLLQNEDPTTGDLPPCCMVVVCHAEEQPDYLVLLNVEICDHLTMTLEWKLSKVVWSSTSQPITRQHEDPNSIHLSTCTALGS